MKNIILIITDTFRYDNLGGRAARPVRTPQLDAFAAERATEVAGFYTGSFPTIPHRTDVTSGRLGWPHFGWGPLQQHTANHAPAILRQAGYASQLICDCPHLFDNGFNRGFDAAYQNRGQEIDRPLLHLNDPIQAVVPADKTRPSLAAPGHSIAAVHRWTNRYYRCEEETFASRTAATTARWLEENWKANPFFLWVDFFDPHEPWDPPEYMVRRYDAEYDGAPMIHPNYGPALAYSPAELRNLWAHYAAESELVDRSIGRVLQKVDDLQLWDETLVVVTSDHGMSIGEHGLAGKCNLAPEWRRYSPIHPEIGHVPFLIAGGGVPRGTSLDLIAQPVDILPTLCDLAEAKAQPPEPFEGKSFAAALMDAGGKHREYAVSGWHPALADGKLKPTEIAPFLTTDKWGYAPLGMDGGRELYDLAADPRAENNVAGSNSKKVEEMHGLFLEHLREHGAKDAFAGLWTMGE